MPTPKPPHIPSEEAIKELATRTVLDQFGLTPEEVPGSLAFELCLAKLRSQVERRYGLLRTFKGNPLEGTDYEETLLSDLKEQLSLRASDALDALQEERFVSHLHQFVQLDEGSLSDLEDQLSYPLSSKVIREWKGLLKTLGLSFGM